VNPASHTSHVQGAGDGDQQEAHRSLGSVRGAALDATGIQPLLGMNPHSHLKMRGTQLGGMDFTTELYGWAAMLPPAFGDDKEFL